MSTQINRRLRLFTLVLISATIVVLPVPSFAQSRKLGTIGPPPRKDPQRQTSAEGLPPLPLPATALRRSEPKAEPAPPTFIARLAYGDTQDFMPNPGDLDNLMRHVRSQIDAWYGHTLVKLDELATLHEQGKTYQVPAIYMVGYEPFEFTLQQRAALRTYLIDGGTLIGMAALGSEQFNASFKNEMQAIFPHRRFDVLQVDHPVMRAYYRYANVHYFAVSQGAAAQSEGPPVLYGLNIAARTAVIHCPYDMTCGWDQFIAPEAPRRGDVRPSATQAVVPEDAIRLGINMIAYVAAQRRFAKTQAQTRQIVGQVDQPRAALTIAQLRHHGDWNPDPNSMYQLIRLASQHMSMPVRFDFKPVDADISQLADTPVLIMTGMDEPRFSSQEIDALRRHLRAGGFLFINNTSGFNKFDREVRELVKQLYPSGALAPVPADHPLLHTLYDIDQMRDASTLQPRPAELEAIFAQGADGAGRAAIVYSRNDTFAMLKGVHDPYANAYDADSARKLALNVLCYAMGN